MSSEYYNETPINDMFEEKPKEKSQDGLDLLLGKEKVPVKVKFGTFEDIELVAPIEPEGDEGYILMNHYREDKIITDIKKVGKDFKKLTDNYKITMDGNLLMISDKNKKFGSFIIDIVDSSVVCGDMPPCTVGQGKEESSKGYTLFNGTTIRMYYYMGKWCFATSNKINAENIYLLNTKIQNSKKVYIVKEFREFIKKNPCFYEKGNIGDKTHQIEFNLDLNQVTDLSQSQTVKKTLDLNTTYIFSFYHPDAPNVINYGNQKMCRYIGKYSNKKKKYRLKGSLFNFEDPKLIEQLDTGIITEDNRIIYSNKYKTREAFLANSQSINYLILLNLSNKDFVDTFPEEKEYYSKKIESMNKKVNHTVKEILKDYNTVYLEGYKGKWIYKFIRIKLHQEYLNTKEPTCEEKIRKILLNYPIEIQLFILDLD